MDINKDSICPLPWNHLSVEPNGKVYSCCQTAEETELGELSIHSLKEIFNSEANQEIRATFLKGETPKQCQICVDAEKWGQISLRQAAKKKFQKVNTATPKITYLSLRLSNLCNLSCRICNPFLSTAWLADAKKLKKPVPLKAVKAFVDDNHFQYFLNNISEDIKILYFAGGEPFLTPQFYQILEKLIKNKRTDLHLLINTNFSVDGLKNLHVFDLLTKFNEVSLDLSLDGMGELNNLMRQGSNWGDIEQRIVNVQKDYPQINLYLNPTVSLLNIFQLTDFFEYMLKRYFKPSQIRINPLLKPNHLNIKNLKSSKKEELIRKIKTFKKSTMLNFSLEELGAFFVQIDGLINMLKEDGDEVEQSNFFLEMNKLDKIRNQNLASLIPEIYKGEL